VFDLLNNKHYKVQNKNTCSMFDFRKWSWDRIKHKIKHRVTAHSTGLLKMKKKKKN